MAFPFYIGKPLLKPMSASAIGRSRVSAVTNPLFSEIQSIGWDKFIIT